MRKTFLLIFVLFATMATLKAQLSIGVKGGLDLSKIGDGKPHPGNVKEPFKLGPNFGIIGEYEADQFWSFYAELGFASKGATYQVSNEQNNLSITHNYVQLTFMPRITFGENTLKGYLNAGATFGHFTGGNWELKGEKSKIKLIKAEDFDTKSETIQYTRDYTNWLEVSLSGGGGLLLTAGPGELMLDIRYDWGLTNLREQYNKQEKVKNKNRVLGLSIGYLYPISTGTGYGYRRRR